jgi:hypothetical protein
LVLFRAAHAGPRIVFPIESTDTLWLRHLFGAIQEAAEAQGSTSEPSARRECLHWWDEQPSEVTRKPRPSATSWEKEYYAEQVHRTEQWFNPDEALQRVLGHLNGLSSDALFNRVLAAEERIKELLHASSESAQEEPYNIILLQGPNAVNETFHFHGQTTFINRPIDTVISDFQNTYDSSQIREQLSQLLRLILASQYLKDEEKESAALIVNEIAAASEDLQERPRLRDRLIALQGKLSKVADIAAPALEIIASLHELIK